MMKEEIVLGHKISEKGIEVNQAEVEVITKLPPPKIIKGVRIFLGHCVDDAIEQCVPEVEMMKILYACHSSPIEGQHGGTRTATKLLQSGFYWP
ncbi:hypothetical protein MTR67_031447 [Solanum verrucosum]|uniref:Integrase zinc-binding domain-containing protein n=1 Tax=Solanum verrucosum TaxID=315347 RepID=A0AAF0U2F0_SOLVR|nr:hypothetical protein MTR67_031447 [Solanum verrucosum]